MSVVTKTYRVEGMSCASCASSSQSMLAATAGVREVQVNYANQTALVSYDEEKADFDSLRTALRKIGYDLRRNEGEELEARRAREARRLRQARGNAIGAMAFSLPVFVLAMFMLPVPGSKWIQLALSLPVLYWFGRQFFVNAWHRAIHFQANMDSLVALGTGSAFLFSLFNTLFPQYLSRHGLEPHLYFEAAVVVISLILLGRYLEERAKAGTSASLEKLIGLRVRQARVLRDGEYADIPLEEVQEGDLILVRPGEKIPVDGTIREGNA